MTSPKRFAALGGGAPVYVEDVFSTNLYTGNGQAQNITNNLAIGSFYGGSVFFNTTGKFEIANSTALAFGTNSFTLEAFVYSAISQSTNSGIGAKGGTSTGFGINVTGTTVEVVITGLGTVLTSGVGGLPIGVWTHVAFVRDGINIYLFLNGVLASSSTTTADLTSTSVLRIGTNRTDGAKFEGFISNFRIVTGTALYTSNFTPSTIPLTPITDTQVLICQNPNPAVDYSLNAFAVTTTGAAISQFSGGPFSDQFLSKGGMVWIKSRSAVVDHALYDTARGATFDIGSNLTTAQTTQATGLSYFNATGFTINALAKLNTAAATYTSWSFRKQPKFFDVVTYTGDGTNRNINHNLQAVPGCIIVKRTDAVSDWQVYHRGFTSAANSMQLNTSGAQAAATTVWNSTAPTSSVFSVGTDATVNANGGTYVAYLFAHDAGGFGALSTDNVITCGSYTGNGSATGPIVTLGYEPQWLLVKNAGATGNSWFLYDNMRGVTISSTGTAANNTLSPNETSLEGAQTDLIFEATGFAVKNSRGAVNSSGGTYIYIAIRRGPMRTPTVGTDVLGLNARTGTGANATVTGGAGVTDLAIIKNRGSAVGWLWASRLTGTGYIQSASTLAEAAASTVILQANPWDVMDGVKVGTTSTTTNASAATFINYLLRRAPGFFDIVCDTGAGGTKTVAHKLGVVPELMIRKKRNSATNSDWTVWHKLFDGTSSYLSLNLTDGSQAGATFWTTDSPTSSVFTVGSGSRVNNLNDTYITFLFASVPGVSSIGSYTGNGTSQTISCGFAAGARFVLIKRTTVAVGDWYVWDTARGIVIGSDSRLSVNTTAAQVTTDDSIDLDNSGFIVNQLAATNINVSASTYIYLAIA